MRFLFVRYTETQSPCRERFWDKKCRNWGTLPEKKQGAHQKLGHFAQKSGEHSRTDGHIPPKKSGGALPNRWSTPQKKVGSAHPNMWGIPPPKKVGRRIPE